MGTCSSNEMEEQVSNVAHSSRSTTHSSNPAASHSTAEPAGGGHARHASHAAPAPAAVDDPNDPWVQLIDPKTGEQVSMKMSEALKLGGGSAGPQGQHSVSAGTSKMKFGTTVTWVYDGTIARCVHGPRENETWLYEGYLRAGVGLFYPYGSKEDGWEWDEKTLTSCKSGKKLHWSGGDRDGALTGGSRTWIRTGEHWYKDGDNEKDLLHFDSARDDIFFLALVADLL